MRDASDDERPPAIMRDATDDERPPDLIRLATPMPASAMRCGEPLQPESLLTTTSGEDGVSVFARSIYQGRDADGQHRWSYAVELKNVGLRTVQLLTRHMVSTAADGRVEESKGAGARGRLPILAPGDTFESSGTALLPTARGAMHGSYQFEALTPRGWGGAFSANMARFALSADGRAATVPCGAEADLLARVLPPTSVYNSYRVLVGASVRFDAAASEPDARLFVFVYEVQMHNGRDKAIGVHWREWGFLDARGALHPESGEGLGGEEDVGRVQLPPGRALQYRGRFTLPTPTGIAAGRFAVSLDDDEAERTFYDVTIAPLGVSIDGSPVPPIEHIAPLVG